MAFLLNNSNKAKKNEKWELMAFLLNNFFQNSRLKYRAPGGSVGGFTVYVFPN
jgi:hypothetical protein